MKKRSRKSKQTNASPTSGKPAVPARRPKTSGAERSKSAGSSQVQPAQPPNQGFCIVGIGASAGGLEALEEFFDHMPSDSGMAFVIIQHLDPGYKSIMVELLTRHTSMKVLQVQDGMSADPNTVYVIPPHKYLGMLHGRFHLLDPDPVQGFRLPIDYFLRSLADDRRERSICIIASGTGTDGTLGLKAIKAAGGLTMVQEEASAKYDSMPRSAIATGSVDFVLPISQMPRELLKYIRHPYVAQAPAAETEAKAPGDADQLEKVFMVLRSHTGHDFSLYKRNTIARRIERRMAVHQIQKITDYVRYLQQNRPEIDALFQELLIGVTSFFRDADAFEVLRDKVIPHLFEQHAPDSPIRVWDAGCSTGEEAYTVAILLCEYMERTSQNRKIQIFATDIDQRSLDLARAGVYPESIAADVSPQRLKYFFVKEGNTFRIKKSVREMVIVAKQDLIKDPPFSKLDLIVCRNLLIYLSPTLQRKILPLFHYTLNPNGYLMLGPSETIGEFADLFGLVDKKWKIFRRKTAARSIADLPSVTVTRDVEPKGALKPSSDATTMQLTERLLLDMYAPPCVIVNEKYDIVHFRGRSGLYLEPPTGEASLNILKMAREGLRIDLRSGLHQAFKRKTAVTRKGVRVRANGGWRTINVVVRPFEQEALDGLAMVVFEEVPQPAVEAPHIEEAPAQTDQRVLELEHELNSTRESLQTTIEELETSNEELKSTNEELQSTNEELQSTNEELETSKEEMQSVNEELVTVNSELQIKLDELSQANNDMTNLLASAEVGTIFLDNNLTIKRFTPSISRVINLIPSDVGRPIGHIAPNLIYDRLTQDVEEVLRTLVFKERELQTKEGNWYLMRIHPYRTLENVIEGAVITFVDISTLKHEKLFTQSALAYASQIMAIMGEPLLVLNKGLKVVTANQSYYTTFAAQPDDTIGAALIRIGNSQWNIPKLKSALDELLPLSEGSRDVEVERTLEQVGRVHARLTVRKVALPGPVNGDQEFLLLAVRSLTAG